MRKFSFILGIGILLTITLLFSTLAIAAFEDWKIDWKQFAGTHIEIGMVRHPMTDSLLPLIPEFEELTGIDVGFEVLSEVQFREKLLVDLASGAGIYDIFNTGPRYSWKYYSSGWLQPLDDFLNNPKLTDAEAYDINDFFPNMIAAAKWTGEFGKGLGEGHLLHIPCQEEAYCLFYRKDILEEAGIKVPETWDELYEAAVKLNDQTFAGKKIKGFVARGIRNEGPILVWISQKLYSEGGRFFDENMNFVGNDAIGVETFEWCAKILQDAGPIGVSNFDWYDCMDGFAAGNYAFFIDADHMNVVFENPDSSQVAGKVGYALCPPGKAGRASEAWYWSMAMSNFSKRKEAAWLFMEWATSKDIMQKTILKGNTDPVRKSVNYSPEVVDTFKKWGYYDMNEELTKYARNIHPPAPNMVEAMFRLGTAFQEVLLKQKTAQQALDDAKRDIDEMMAPFKK